MGYNHIYQYETGVSDVEFYAESNGITHRARKKPKMG